LAEWWIVVQFFGELFEYREIFFGDSEWDVAHVGRADESGALMANNDDS
jgi:hypothetical protein